MDKLPTSGSGADSAPPTDPWPAEELLVVDDRAGLRPSEMVERKLVKLLKKSPMPVSQSVTGRRVLRSH